MKQKPLLTETGYACVDESGRYFSGMKWDQHGTSQAMWAPSPFYAHLFQDTHDIGDFMKVMDTSEEGSGELKILKMNRSAMAEGKPMKAVKENAKP